MIIEQDLRQKDNFNNFYRRYELYINNCAKRLATEIGKFDDFDDYKQVGALALFEIYEKYKSLREDHTKQIVKNKIRDHRRRDYTYDKKRANSVGVRGYRAINLYQNNIFRIRENEIIERVDILNIIKEIKNKNAKLSFYLRAKGYNLYEISKLLNITPQAISKNIKNINQRVNSYYKGEL